mmetsp:Transcript_96383/g.281647  ORF Transcript_96383/g.281647 Transcript_96383/m.281647 type:complete len:389 (+) Transcript_96383:888-2054(+)
MVGKGVDRRLSSKAKDSIGHVKNLVQTGRLAHGKSPGHLPPVINVPVMAYELRALSNRILAPPLLINVVPRSAVQNVAEGVHRSVDGRIDAQHRHAYVVQLQKVPGQDLAHGRVGGVPVWHAVHVTTAAAAVPQRGGAAEPAGLLADLTVVQGLALLVVEALRRGGVPAPRALHAPVAVAAAVPAPAGRGPPGLWVRPLGFRARARHVVHDDIHNDLHAGGAAGRHHGGEVLFGARACVQAEGDRLVLGPPLVAQDVLRHGRDLHGIEAVRPQELAALAANVYIVPLPELCEDGAAPLAPEPAARGLLVATEAAEDRSAFWCFRCGRRAADRLRDCSQLQKLKFLPTIYRESVGVEAAVGLRTQGPASGTPDRDGAILVVGKVKLCGG